MDNGNSSDSWSFEDEDDEPQSSTYACSNGTLPHGGASSSNPGRSKTISYFTSMGFAEELVLKVIAENGDGNEGRILETLLSYKEIEVSSPHLSEKDRKMLELVEMGFHIDEVSSAINACDPDTSTHELVDHISAAQIAKATSLEIPKVDSPLNSRKKKLSEQEGQWERGIGSCRSNGRPEMGKRIKLSPEAEDVLKPALSMRLPDAATGALYFFFETGASSYLHNFKPEFVDSKSFSAVSNRRAYVHNLPTENRFRLLPSPPLTIFKALPHTADWWPWWDTRVQFDSLDTCNGSCKPTEVIRRSIANCNGAPTPNVQKSIVNECQRFNLVWTGRNTVSPLEPEELEKLLGYPEHHTRGGGTRTDRYKALGNAVQVDTIAYHLSTLKEIFPNGISVLSILPGIGGAEIALSRLGIQLNLVVTVENSKVNREIFRSWWESNDQRGKLDDSITDLNMLTSQKLKEIVSSYGGFDLIVGGTRCNDKTGSSQRARDYLEGNNSCVLDEYTRILEEVKRLMEAN
ncbi:DNA (cytosine-5)-methyltransferase DRM2-like [Papaver somniferum]|uniref:DNA (cytosine-5)-methyltransferase DRM2-like n=1 Tax=Papaver somniferum TaxID=3469 RepID=UPI000E704D65|nr:DNA (cytosine-5)-methyltransferase DRM2-like [Papaver somniferum]XP_026445308.1 DNA (cytosine-5)-methyltransferase DRM2-like [Papaver somniferum]